jgi:hypothetical protein
MNENDPSVPSVSTPNVPTAFGALHIEPARLPLGEDPSDRAPIPNLLASIEALLRHPRRVIFHLRQPGARKLIPGMILVILLCSALYGIIVGTFSGGMQFWIAPLKIVAGLFISGLICLPSLYIFTCLSGSQARLAEVTGLLAGFLMLMTIMLVGFAPVAWIFSQSTESLTCMGALHLVFWFVAVAFGVRFMLGAFSHSNAKTHLGLDVWIVLFVLVALQMTTALRPILGKADTVLPKEKKFFLSHWSDCLDQATRDENAKRR